MSVGQKQEFVRELAKYLAGNQVEQSVRLQMADPHALQWRELRTRTPLHGYPTVEEAQAVLGKWFGGEFQE